MARVSNFLTLETTIFCLEMMVKSGLESYILIFHHHFKPKIGVSRVKKLLILVHFLAILGGVGNSRNLKLHGTRRGTLD